MTKFKDALFFGVRHGETFLNENDMFRGWSNGPDARLNKKGIRQARVAGRFISKLPVKFNIVRCSDLDRAKHTAAIIAKILGIKEVHSDSRLRPLNVGTLAGEKKSEHPIDEYIKNPDLEFPGGESIRDFDSRQKEFAEEFLPEAADDKDGYILIVCHVSNLMYWDNLRKPKDEYLDEKTDIVDPGGVVEVTPEEVVPLFREHKPESEDK
jgi:broad specificity phosphatase PhoE